VRAQALTDYVGRAAEAKKVFFFGYAFLYFLYSFLQKRRRVVREKH
jgi:hypothetical protein